MTEHPIPEIVEMRYPVWAEEIDALGLDDDNSHLEKTGQLEGCWDVKRGRIIIERITKSMFVQPYSRDETVIDWRSMWALGDSTIGFWYTHPSGTLAASEIDRQTWRSVSKELDDIFVTMIFGPVERWSGGFPGWSWDEPQAPLMRAYITDPRGRPRLLTELRQSRATSARNQAWVLRVR